MQNYLLENARISAYGTTAGGLSLPVSPLASIVSIVQGTGQGGRIGNRIKTKKCTLSINLSPLGYNAASNIVPVPQVVVGYLYYDMQNTTAVSPPGADFIQFGNSSTALTGRIIDAMSAVNTDRYKLYKKFFVKSGWSQNTGTGAAAGVAFYANNDFNADNRIDIDVTSMMPKYVEFNDNSGNPQTRNLLLYLEAVRMDGGANPLASETTNVNVAIDYRYSDA